jgi:hypothetical protein
LAVIDTGTDQLIGDISSPANPFGATKVSPSAARCMSRSLATSAGWTAASNGSISTQAA